MKNIIIAILVVLVLVLGFLFFTQKKSNVSYEPWPETEPATVRPTTTTNNTTNNYPVQNNSTPTQTNPATQVNTNNQTTNSNSPNIYKNDQLGISFNFSGFSQVENFTTTPGDTGKMFFGNLMCDGGTICVRFGGITENFTAPMGGESYLVKNFPDATILQQLSQNGYVNEIKTNSKGEQYVLIYGKREVDMPYIGEGQMLAIFRLKSSTEFKAIGLHFYYGNQARFLQMIDSVVIY